MIKTSNKLIVPFIIIFTLSILVILLSYLYPINAAKKAVTHPPLQLSKDLTTPPIEALTINDTEHANQSLPPTLDINGLKHVLRPSWLIKDNLTLHIEQLKSAFKQGDSESGYRLAMNLRKCLHAPLNITDLSNKVSRAEQANESPEFIAGLQQRFVQCEGVSLKERQEFYYFMQQAAQQGFVPAQESFASLHAELYMTSQNKQDLPRADYIASRNKFVSEKLFYLRAAAERGSLYAVKQLANLYNSQNYGSNGLVKAYAYNQVILSLTDNNTLYNRYQWFQERLAQRLSIEEVSQALNITEHTLEKINDHGTRYSITYKREH